MKDTELLNLTVNFLDAFDTALHWDFDYTKMLIQYEEGKGLLEICDPEDPCNDMNCLGQLYIAYQNLAAYINQANQEKPDPNDKGFRSVTKPYTA